MNKLTGGSLYRDDYIDVVSLQGTGLVRLEGRPPKLIVAMSVTHPNEKFKPGQLVFPVVIDTGFNKAFEIDQRHLYFWNATPKVLFPLLQRRDRSASGKMSYDIREAKLWLHPEPYTGPKLKGRAAPIPLHVSDQIRILDGPPGEPDPRFPLLGMEALIQNHLLLFVDGRSFTFEIYD